MKELFLKYKKNIKIFINMGTTLLIISFFSFVAGTKYLTLGILSLIIGIICIIIFIISLKKSKELINKMKLYCPICNKEVIKEERIDYYVNGVLTEDVIFNNSLLNKEKDIFTFYKCRDCFYCLTEIKRISYKNNKIINNKESYNVDFEYNGQY